MNYDIKCSKCQRLADTHICSRLWSLLEAHATTTTTYGSLSQHCQWLSAVTQTKLTKVYFKTRELVLASVAAFAKTPAFPPNLIIQWIEVG